MREKLLEILKHLSSKDYIISLAIKGTELSSPELADKIEYYFYLDHKKKKILQNNAYQTALQG